MNDSVEDIRGTSSEEHPFAVILVGAAEDVIRLGESLSSAGLQVEPIEAYQLAATLEDPSAFQAVILDQRVVGLAEFAAVNVRVLDNLLVVVVVDPTPEPSPLVGVLSSPVVISRPVDVARVTELIVRRLHGGKVSDGQQASPVAFAEQVTPSGHTGDSSAWGQMDHRNELGVDGLLESGWSRTEFGTAESLTEAAVDLLRRGKRALPAPDQAESDESLPVAELIAEKTPVSSFPAVAELIAGKTPVSSFPVGTDVGSQGEDIGSDSSTSTNAGDASAAQVSGVPGFQMPALPAEPIPLRDASSRDWALPNLPLALDDADAQFGNDSTDGRVHNGVSAATWSAFPGEDSPPPSSSVSFLPAQGDWGSPSSSSPPHPSSSPPISIFPGSISPDDPGFDIQSHIGFGSTFSEQVIALLDEGENRASRVDLEVPTPRVSNGLKDGGVEPVEDELVDLLAAPLLVVDENDDDDLDADEDGPRQLTPPEGALNVVRVSGASEQDRLEPTGAGEPLAVQGVQRGQAEDFAGVSEGTDTQSGGSSAFQSGQFEVGDIELAPETSGAQPRSSMGEPPRDSGGPPTVSASSQPFGFPVNNDQQADSTTGVALIPSVEQMPPERTPASDGASPNDGSLDVGQGTPVRYPMDGMLAGGDVLIRSESPPSVRLTEPSAAGVPGAMPNISWGPGMLERAGGVPAVEASASKESTGDALPVNEQPQSGQETSFRDHLPEVLTTSFDGVALLGTCVRERVTGTLRLGADDDVYHVVLRDGDFVACGVEDVEKSLVVFLAARGDLPREVGDSLRGHVPPFGRLAAAALIANGYLRQENLWPVLRAHAEWVLMHLVLLTAGTCKLLGEPPGRLRHEPSVFGGATGAEVFVEVVRRSLNDAVARERLGGGHVRLALGPSARLLAECALSDIEQSLVGEIEGKSLGEVEQGRGEIEVGPLFVALVALRVVQVLPVVGAAANSSMEDEAVDEFDEAAVRTRIQARLRLVEEGDYFSLLGVSRDATSYAIRQAYVTLRRELEPTTLLTAALADLADDVETIISVLDEAYDVLREPARRQRYRRAIEASPPAGS